jgi:hypothetical protein
MTDAMQTIRSELDKAIIAVQKMDSVDPMALLEMGYGYSIEAQPIIDAICSALTALDSLAVEPSEDAVELLIKIREESHGLNDDGDWYDYFKMSHGSAAALIQARDERIRSEQRNLFRDVLKTCLDAIRERARVVASLGGITTKKWDDEERMLEAAILGTEPARDDGKLRDAYDLSETITAKVLEGSWTAQAVADAIQKYVEAQK